MLAPTPCLTAGCRNHTVSEETTPSYVVNGLLNWATEQYTPAVYDLEFDDDDE